MLAPDLGEKTLTHHDDETIGKGDKEDLVDEKPKGGNGVHREEAVFPRIARTREVRYETHELEQGEKDLNDDGSRQDSSPRLFRAPEAKAG